MPASKVKVVDTVGAGDTFCGYLAAGPYGGVALEEAVRLGLIAASRAWAGHGAQASLAARPLIASIRSIATPQDSAKVVCSFDTSTA